MNHRGDGEIEKRINFPVPVIHVVIWQFLHLSHQPSSQRERTRKSKLFAMLERLFSYECYAVGDVDGCQSDAT